MGARASWLTPPVVPPGLIRPEQGSPQGSTRSLLTHPPSNPIHHRGRGAFNRARRNASLSFSSSGPRLLECFCLRSPLGALHLFLLVFDQVSLPNELLLREPYVSLRPAPIPQPTTSQCSIFPFLLSPGTNHLLTYCIVIDLFLLFVSPDGNLIPVRSALFVLFSGVSRASGTVPG